MEYLGFKYIPEVLEDEDTRKLIHDVYFDGKCVGSINGSPYSKPTLEQFKQWVDEYIQTH